MILLDSTFIKTLIPRLVPDSPSLSPRVGQRNPPLVVSLQQMCQSRLWACSVISPLWGKVELIQTQSSSEQSSLDKTKGAFKPCLSKFTSRLGGIHFCLSIN